MNFYTDEHGRRFQYRLTMNMHPFRARMPTRTRSTAGQTAPERCMIGWSPAMARPPLPPRTDPTAKEAWGFIVEKLNYSAETIEDNTRKPDRNVERHTGKLQELADYYRRELEAM